MKKILLLLATVGLLATACEAGGVDEGGNGTPKPSNKIATIEEQGANITATIATLQTTKSAVETTITSLKASEEPATRGNDNGNNGVKTMIAALEERLAALEQMIANLTGYTQGDLTEIQDWATATFATMEQYSALASELATLKAAIAEIEGVSTTELSEALAASEESMKQWVNEQLAGYATIADVEAQIVALQASLTEELKAEVEKVVATLTALMNDTKQEYEKAIAEAIQNQGIINDKIAEDIANINKRIDEELATINKRLDDIEKRLDEIEETVKDLVNRIQSVSYIKKYGDEATPVITSAEGVSVTLDFEMSPKNTIEGLELKWKEYMKVQALYSGTTDFIDMPITSFSADAEKGIITIVVSGENLSDEFFSGIVSASLRLEISDGNNDKRSEYIPIVPQCWMQDCMDLEPAHNEIYYTTADNNTITLANIEGFGAALQTNLYDREKGLYVLKFDGDIISIGDKAFIGCSNLTCIAIPNSVTSIGDEAFHACTSLTSITIPDSVTAIGKNAFYECTSLDIVNITDLSAWCRIRFDIICTEQEGFFYSGTNPLQYSEKLYLNGSLVTDIVIPSDITCVYDGVFCNCSSLTSITVPDSVTSIGMYAFLGCAGELTLNCGCLGLFSGQFSKLTIGDSATEIGRGAFYHCNSLTDVTIGKNITSIGDHAFDNCTSLTNVTIPDSVTSIGTHVFYNCTSLASATIPASVITIGGAAFYNCTSLTSITIPDSVTSIGWNAFLGCTGELIINSKIMEATPIADWLNGVTKLTIGDNITKIGELVFAACTSLVSVTIGNSVTEIGMGAFYDCTSLISISIPDSVTSIGNNAFFYCTSLTEVTIGNNVTSIGAEAFRDCTSLTSISIPDSVIEIGNFAFGACTSLTSIEIGNGVSAIEQVVFGNCTSLTTIVISEGNNTYDSRLNCNAIIETGTNTLILGCNTTIIPYGVTSIGSCAFQDCFSLISITIPDSVTTIGDCAFQSCSALTSITIPDGVTSIGDSAFRNCNLLKKVYCKPTTPPTGGYNMFQDNSAERKIYVPQYNVSNYKSAEYWRDYANCIVGYDFANNSTEIDINTVPANRKIIYTSSDYQIINPYSNRNFGANIILNTYNKGQGIIVFDGQISSIGTDAFCKCRKLTSITIPDGVTSIGDNAFYGCDSLTSAKIPHGVTTIGDHAFYLCKSMTNVSIPDSVTEIKGSAFQGCRSLTSITISDNVTSIGNSAFNGCSSLISICCKPTTPPAGGASMFNNNASGRQIYVPRNSVNAYKAKQYWSNYASDIVGYDF